MYLRTLPWTAPEAGPTLAARPLSSQTLLYLAFLASLILTTEHIWKLRVMTLAGPTKLMPSFSISLSSFKLKGGTTTIFQQTTIYKISQHV